MTKGPFVGCRRNKQMFWRLLLAVGFVCQGVNPLAAAEKPVVMVFAAVSLADPLREIARRFQEQNNTEIVLSFAGSGLLAVQIEKGGQADIFISAGASFADTLIDRQIVFAVDRKDLLTNTLVVITQEGNTELLTKLADLKDNTADFLSIGDPATVPAGQYARDALISAGIWEALEGHIALAVDVRAAVLQVALGNARFGIVYKTDIVESDPIKIVYEIPGQMHRPIRYVICLLKSSRGKNEAVKFFHYLESVEAKNIFIQRGFKVL